MGEKKPEGKSVAPGGADSCEAGLGIRRSDRRAERLSPQDQEISPRSVGHCGPCCGQRIDERGNCGGTICDELSSRGWITAHSRRGAIPFSAASRPEPFPETPRISSLWRLTGARQIDFSAMVESLYSAWISAGALRPENQLRLQSCTEKLKRLSEQHIQVEEQIVFPRAQSSAGRTGPRSHRARISRPEELIRRNLGPSPATGLDLE